MAIAQFSGLASGIDSSALIDAVIKARESNNELRRAEIEHLNSENTSLDELNTKLLALNDLIDKFRTVNNGGVSKKGSSSDATVATAIVGSNATISSLSLTVQTIANSATASTDYSYAAADSYASIAGSGDITIQIGSGADLKTITIPVTQNVTTISDVVAAINADTNAAGNISASVVNIGTSAAADYRIVLSTLQQGTAKGSLSVTADGALTELNNNFTTSQATDAEFTLSGITGTITRSSNTINDVIPGITLQLAKGGGVSTTISVSNDAQGTSDQMKEIVDAYNDIVKYINENDTITRVEQGTTVSNDYGSLAKTRVDNDFLTQFREKLSAAAASTGSTATTMSAVGISTNRDGTVSFDEDVFKEAVGEDPLGVQELLNDFADSTAGINGMIYEFTKFNGYIDLAQSSNNSEKDNLNAAIDQLERYTAKLRSSLEGQFARLETTTARLQSTQQQLTGILGALG